MAIAFFLMATVSAFFTYVFYQGQIALKYIDSVKARYLALSGIKYMGGRDFYESTNGEPPFPVTLSYGPDAFSLPGYAGGTFTIRRSGSDETHLVTLTSTGSIKNTSRSITVRAGGKGFMDLATHMYGSSYNDGVYIHDLPVVEWKTKKD